MQSHSPFKREKMGAPGIGGLELSRGVCCDVDSSGEDIYCDVDWSGEDKVIFRSNEEELAHLAVRSLGQPGVQAKKGLRRRSHYPFKRGEISAPDCSEESVKKRSLSVQMRRKRRTFWWGTWSFNIMTVQHPFL